MASAQEAVKAAGQGKGIENGLGSSLALLSSPFGGGLPSLSGGDAGPSTAISEASGWVIFNNPFSVTGVGDASANASAQPSSTGGISTNMLMLAGLGLAAVILIARK